LGVFNSSDPLQFAIHQQFGVSPPSFVGSFFLEILDEIFLPLSYGIYSSAKFFLKRKLSQKPKPALPGFPERLSVPGVFQLFLALAAVAQRAIL